MRALFALSAFAASIAAFATPAVAQNPSAKSAKSSDEDKVICKRQVETGSLVRATKTCKTKREWKDQVANAQDTMTRNVGSGSIDVN